MPTRMQTRTAVGASAVVLALLGAGLQAPVLGATSAAPGGGATTPTARAATPAGVLDGPERAVIAKRVIGRTVKDRPIRAYRLGERSNKWTVVAIGAMHGNEQQTPRPLLHLRDHLPIEGMNLWVIPVMNPDGYRRGTRKNARGVDLNRNFPAGALPQGHRSERHPRRQRRQSLATAEPRGLLGHERVDRVPVVLRSAGACHLGGLEGQ
ncbi:hypothetical protein BH20ACT6_BH20ACT6_01580 [soil metagenome]